MLCFVVYAKHHFYKFIWGYIRRSWALCLTANSATAHWSLTEALHIAQKCSAAQSQGWIKEEGGGKSLRYYKLS